MILMASAFKSCPKGGYKAWVVLLVVVVLWLLRAKLLTGIGVSSWTVMAAVPEEEGVKVVSEQPELDVGGGQRRVGYGPKASPILGLARWKVGGFLSSDERGGGGARGSGLEGVDPATDFPFLDRGDYDFCPCHRGFDENSIMVHEWFRMFHDSWRHDFVVTWCSVNFVSWWKHSGAQYMESTIWKSWWKWRKRLCDFTSCHHLKEINQQLNYYNLIRARFHHAQQEMANKQGVGGKKRAADMETLPPTEDKGANPFLPPVV